MDAAAIEPVLANDQEGDEESENDQDVDDRVDDSGNPGALEQTDEGAAEDGGRRT